MTKKERPTLSLKPKAKPAPAAAPAARKPGPRPADAPRPAGKRPDAPARSDAPRASGPRPAASPRPAGNRPDEQRADGQRPAGKRPDTAARSDAPRPAGQRPAAAPRADSPRPGGERPAPAQGGAVWPARAGAGARPARARVGDERPAAAKPQLRESHQRDFKPRVQTEFQAELKQDSLAFAMLGAATAAVQVKGGMALPQALNGIFTNANATPQARGAIQDIAYRAMRQLGRSEALITLMAPKAPDPMVQALLSVALPLMMATEEGPAPYEAFTVVDQAVTAAGSHPDTARAKGMVNALLRRFLREKDELLEEALRDPVAQWNYPQWWIDNVITSYPKEWQDVLSAGNKAPPLTLRVNTRRNSVEDYLQRLSEEGIEATRIGPQAVRLARPIGVHLIPGFAEGLVSVQDAGAQLAAPLLDLQAGQRVLDACAAPGGKTCHILELADVNLTALDADAKRLQRVQENLDRLQFQATLQPAEAQTSDWWDGQPFDRILADVPCTASGIVRRHPDIRWLRRKADARQLATLSSQILDNLWRMLAPNGKLLFVTCSLWPQESEAQAAAFAVRNRATRLEAPGQLLPEGGAEQDHDGLFYALFQKSDA